MIAAKTVCVVATQQRPPEFVASMRDKDTDSCRELRASPAGSALVPRFALPSGGPPAQWRVVPRWFDPLRPNFSVMDKFLR
jgi:hypothetical protein